MIYISGTAEDQQQFGAPFNPNVKYLQQFDPTMARPGQYGSSAIKIFAGEHAGGRALFIYTGIYLLACGAIGAYGLVTAEGVAGDANTFTCIRLPEEGDVSKPAAISDIGINDNKLVILTKDLTLWFNGNAVRHYGIATEHAASTTGFFRCPLPAELQVLRDKAHQVEPKIILGTNTIYILLSCGHVIEYSLRVPEVKSSRRFSLVTAPKLFFKAIAADPSQRAAGRWGKSAEDLVFHDIQLVESGSELLLLNSEKLIYRVKDNKCEPLRAITKENPATFMTWHSKSGILYGRSNNGVYSYDEVSEKTLLAAGDARSSFPVIGAAVSGDHFIKLYHDKTNNVAVAWGVGLAEARQGSNLVPLFPGSTLGDPIFIPAISQQIVVPAPAVLVTEHEGLAQRLTAALGVVRAAAAAGSSESDDDCSIAWSDDEDDTVPSTPAAAAVAGLSASQRRSGMKRERTIRKSRK
jgi:hypothetical protein